MKMREVGEWFNAVPSGSTIHVLINDAGNLRLRRVTPDKVGSVGPTGPAGANGASILNGVGAPAVAAGGNGDYYIDTATGSLYQKSANVWALVGTFAGPAGPTGAAGAAGANGAPGAPGVTPTPGGLDTYFQYNNGGSWGGTSGFTYDDTNNVCTAKNVNITPETLVYNANMALNFLSNGLQSVDLVGNVVFTSSNLAGGRAISVKILASGAPRTVTYPVAWTVWLGTVPANPFTVASGKTGVLSLTSWTAADAGITAVWVVEP